MIICYPHESRNGILLGKCIIQGSIDAKFQEAKSYYLGRLIIIAEMLAKKIKAMNNNKSPGVDGIPPKLVMETVEQISIPLARVFNLSLKEVVVPFEWKEANIIPLFKKGSRNK